MRASPRPRALAAALIFGASGASVLCACIQARVIGKDGRQYNLDGTERVPPKQRAKDAGDAMGACNREVTKLQQSFRRDAVGAVVALSSGSAKNAKARATLTIGAADADPILTLTPDAASTKAGAAAATPSPYGDAVAALSTSLRGSLDEVQKCSDATLTAVKVMHEEAHYLTSPEVQGLLEMHWRATQHLTRAKEIAVASVALALAVGDAAKGKPAALAATTQVLGDQGDKLFADVAFDHDLRREVLLQGIYDTDESCGARDDAGQNTCDKIMGAFKVAKGVIDTAKTVSDTVSDVKAGRILQALDKAQKLASGGGADDEKAQWAARREAVLPLIPETPALDRLTQVLAHASAGEGKAARAAGRTVIASDGVVQLLAAADH
jgi:hypothetical protein